MIASDSAVFSEDLGFIEGPVWNAEARTLNLVSIDRGCVYTLDAAGRVVATYQTGGGPNGLVLGSDGLFVAQNGGIFGASGLATPGVQSIIGGVVDYALSGGFTAPNDLAFGPDGRLYVTDPQTDRAILEPIPGCVVACELGTGIQTVVASDRLCPNGLAFTADGQRMLLAQTQARLVEQFLFSGTDLLSQGIFCELTNGRPDGMALDQADNLWICTPGTGGVEVFDAGGKFVRRIEIGADSMTTNLCFGGEDGRDLFVTAAKWGKVIRLRTELPGLALLRGSMVA